MIKMLGALLVSLAIAGCASRQPVPEGYVGPTAIVGDSVNTADPSKPQVFALMRINGEGIDNTFVASARASSGKGFQLTTRMEIRKVFAKPMKATIRGSHITAAPIQQIMRSVAGTFYSVEGVVDFSPQPDKVYAVRGELKPEGSAVWIEDVETNQRVTEKIVSK